MGLGFRACAQCSRVQKLSCSVLQIMVCLTRKKKEKLFLLLRTSFKKLFMHESELEAMVHLCTSDVNSIHNFDSIEFKDGSNNLITVLNN